MSDWIGWTVLALSVIGWVLYLFCGGYRFFWQLGYDWDESHSLRRAWRRSRVR